MIDMVVVNQHSGINSRGESILSAPEQVVCLISTKSNKVTKSKDGQDVSVAGEMRAYKSLALGSLVVDGSTKYVIVNKEQIRGLYGDTYYYVYDLEYSR